MAIKVILVDRHHHVDHLPRCNLGLLVVLFIRMCDVAVLAFDAKRARDELHRGDDLLRGYALERLNIVVLFFRKFWPRRRRRSFRCAGLRPRARQREAQ